MAEARHFCPDCGSIDLIFTRGRVLVSADQNAATTANCPNCTWSGTLSETIGAITSEQFWDVERVGRVLLRVVSRHGAGPIVQVLEFVGILPRIKTAPDDETPAERLRAYNTWVLSSRDLVMREIFTAAITAGFETAQKVAAHGVATGVRRQPTMIKDTE